MKMVKILKYQQRFSEKKVRGIKLPDINATNEFFNRFDPHKFLKTNAEKPKQILKKKLIKKAKIMLII